MKTKSFTQKPLLIIGAIILLALVGFFFLRNSSGSSLLPSGTGGTDDSSSAKSLKDLLGSSVSQECTFKDDQGNESTIKVAGGKMRGDFTTMVDGKSTGSHMITMNNTTNFWMDGQTTGYKMNIDSLSKDAQTNAQPSAGSSIDVNEKMNMSCKPAVVSGSNFTLPTGVTFTDIGAMMNQQTPSGADTKALQCATCASLTGDDKTQCLAVLGCN